MAWVIDTHNMLIGRRLDMVEGGQPKSWTLEDRLILKFATQFAQLFPSWNVCRTSTF